jgi:hypothetical protein
MRTASVTGMWRLMLLGLFACGGALTPRMVSVDAGPDACSTDAECGPGLVCEGCPSVAKQCVPGCRSDDQCGAFRVCGQAVQCLSCPCAPGWCTLDPCRDVDGDGFAAERGVQCPGKGVGDCDDRNPRVRPGRAEFCGNYVDDNCDGAADEGCGTCNRRCVDSLSCPGATSGASQCVSGCCETCPQLVPPQCQPGQCLYPAPNVGNGCAPGPQCGACVSCPSDDSPVCGSTFSTYANACIARALGAEVLYAGPCKPTEGRSCYAGYGQRLCEREVVCRLSSPGDDLGRCLSRGLCRADSDCDLQMCDGGVPRCSGGICQPCQ